MTIQDTAKEPIIAGEYHFGDSGWNVPSPSDNRMYVANSILSSGGASVQDRRLAAELSLAQASMLSVHH